MHPIVGVTAQQKMVLSSNGDLESQVVGHTYTDSVLRAGGLPVVLPPLPAADVPALVDRLDGLVFSGGGDIEPWRYGEESHETIRRTNAGRDEFELALACEARERRLPVLAICRGIQIFNVAYGGTLFQDIPSMIGSKDHMMESQAVFNGHHPITIESGSMLAKATGATELMVNSVHHQAIKDLAPVFRPVAWAADGVIEGIQHEDDEWPLLAVQWHPEFLDDNGDKASRRLFESLVDSIRFDPV
jgi:gamma-glutamyl-gamma-aminobutyrate hydrolase PuuD